MFVQDHHSLEELQRLTKALRLNGATGTQLVIDSSCVPVSIRPRFYSPLADGHGLLNGLRPAAA